MRILDISIGTFEIVQQAFSQPKWRIQTYQLLREIDKKLSPKIWEIMPIDISLKIEPLHFYIRYIAPSIKKNTINCNYSEVSAKHDPI